MRWFKDWLMQQTNDNPVEMQHSRPWQEPPPMPPCKPPKKDISEPVITLLEMLERDEWEYTIKSEIYAYSEIVTNVYKESVTLTTVEGAISSKKRLRDYEWMTDVEKDEVIKAVGKAHKRNKTLQAKVAREAFAIKLGVVNERN